MEEYEYITFIFKVLLLATVGLLLGSFFKPEDGGGMFHQTQNHSALQPRRPNSS
jgi:hypothetical protein